MSAKIEPLMTVDDLEAMPEDTNRYEVIEGEPSCPERPAFRIKLLPET